MADKTIQVENYQENPEVDYSHGMQYKKNLEMFFKSGQVLYGSTRNIYNYLKDYCIDFTKNHPQYPDFIWKPKICDVACGGGFGSNVLSQEADFVWGIDIDQDSIKFAQKMFTREKNGYYYSNQLTFDVINVLDEPREMMQFDMVVAVEVIEHLGEYEKLLSFIKRLCKRQKGGYIEGTDATKVFISTPNRNHPKIGDLHPKNKKHVREWTPGELYEILNKHFKSVTLMNSVGELRDLDMKDDTLFFKCECPL